MIVNPPLNDELLIHFGVKGMRWGQRKQRPDEQKRKETFGPSAVNKGLDRGRKIRRAAIIVGGGLAVGLILSKRGRQKVTDLAVHNYVQGRQAKATAGQNPFGGLARQFRETRVSMIPSPNQMMAEARMAGVRNKVRSAANANLVDRTWRDSANFNRLNRSLPGGNRPLTTIPSLEEIRKRLEEGSI